MDRQVGIGPLNLQKGYVTLPSGQKSVQLQSADIQKVWLLASSVLISSYAVGQAQKSHLPVVSFQLCVNK